MQLLYVFIVTKNDKLIANTYIWKGYTFANSHAMQKIAFRTDNHRKLLPKTILKDIFKQNYECGTITTRHIRISEDNCVT